MSVARPFASGTQPDLGATPAAGPVEVSGREIDQAGEELPLLEGIRTTRAIRRLRPDPVPPELIRKVCEAGTFAPSGGNRQPWSFIAVTDPEKRAWIAARYRDAFERYLAPAREAAESGDFPEDKRRMQRAAIWLAEHLHQVPVHLVVAGWTRRGQPQAQALFPAIQNILLACRAVGLGASLTTAHRAFGPELDRMLGLPEACPSIALLPIGWPLGRYGRPPRKSVDRCLHWEVYDPERTRGTPAPISGAGGPDAR
ncbi:MAG: nitroreductase family protein [Myxococcota bacterium]|nr:nitroreductase family protein [Myxococcota bacterium]